ncbi:hypothetical protein Hdeb2414_s0046g00747621 [Helianthus debilis subsp. tardiflorus]
MWSCNSKIETWKPQRHRQPHPGPREGPTHQASLARSRFATVDHQKKDPHIRQCLLLPPEDLYQTLSLKLHVQGVLMCVKT